MLENARLGVGVATEDRRGYIISLFFHSRLYTTERNSNFENFMLFMLLELENFMLLEFAIAYIMVCKYRSSQNVI